MAEDSEVELDAKQGKVRVRGPEIIGILTFIFVVLGGFLTWNHNSEAKDSAERQAISSEKQNAAMVTALKELTGAVKEQVQVQRTMNCIISLPQERRETAAQTCERISR